ncbi:MAG: hypothetical protein ACRENY_06685, partial [Candidatus Dormibacteria bacterium]
VISQYLAAVAADPGTMATLRKYQVSLVWQGRESPLSRLLEQQRGWTCVFASKRNLLFASPGHAGGWHASRAGCPS